MKLININNRKGFTMIELLCATVILGVISVFAIKGISGLITRAKEEQFQQHERTLEIAAESFLQANNQYKPKSIGEVRKIPIIELKKANYLKDDILNSGGESCMTNSYVRVYKLSKTEYTYLSYLYCGSEKAPAEETVPTPTLHAYYTDRDGTNAGQDDTYLQNTSAIKLVIEITGGKTASGTEIELDGYSYTIIKDEENVVYDSGTLSANRNTNIKINKDLSDYIKVNEESMFKVMVTATNIYGGYTEITSKIDSPTSQVTLSDTTPPICESIENDAQDGVWINKTSQVRERTITVVCTDGDGSGCVRDTFSKTWPNKQENSTEDGIIEIKDNAGNATKCPVKVLVDVTSPTVSIDAYKAAKSGSTYSKTGSSALSTGAQKTADNNRDSGIINATDYKNLYSGWMNAANYPNGVIYEIKVSDDFRLGSWTWSTNIGNISDTNSADYSIVSLSNPEAASGTFEGNTKEKTITVRLETNGMRKGILTVRDLAGNEINYTIYANINTATPTIKIGGSSACPAGLDASIDLNKYAAKDNSNVGEAYTPGTWSNLPVIVRVFENCIVDTPAGQGDYIFKVKLDGQSAVEVRQTSRRFDFYDPTNPTKYEGSATVSVALCDKAGNCTDFSEEKKIMIDTIAPTCNVTATSDNKDYTGSWIAATKSVRVTATCSEPSSKVTTSGCVNNATFKSTFYKDYSTTAGSYLSIKNAGAVDSGQGGQISDNAGNVTNCAANKSINIDGVAPKCNVTATSSYGSVYNGSWLKKDEFVTVTGTCSDSESGCDPSASTVSHKYNSNMSITNGGPGGQGVGGVVKDKVGNTTTCASNITIKIDQTPPTCTNSGDSTTWTNGDRTITWGCNDTGGSGCKSGSSGGNKTYTTDTKTSKIDAYTISDNAGNTVKCPERTANVYVDKTPPTCTKDGDSTTWTKSDRKITWGCSDTNGSGCDPNNSGSSKNFTSSTKTSKIAAYTIKDNAGNTTNCPERTANVYVDKTAPKCNGQDPNVTAESYGNKTVSAICSDDHSGCKQEKVAKTFTPPTDTGEIEIEDKVGNKTTCTVNVKISNQSACDFFKGKKVEDLFGKQLGVGPDDERIANYINCWRYATRDGKSGGTRSWGNWCNANSTTCNASGGYYMVCASDRCGAYKGWTVLEINELLANQSCGQEFVKYWCRCGATDTFDWANSHSIWDVDTLKCT